MIHINVHHNCTPFLFLWNSSYAKIDFTSFNTGKWDKVCVLKWFIDQVVWIFQIEQMLQIKKISLSVPLWKLVIFLIEYRTILGSYLKFLLSLSHTGMPCLHHLNVIQSHQNLFLWQADTELHFKMMSIVFVPVNMQSLPALTMNRLVILQGIKFVQIIAWEHDIEHVHIVVFFMTDYSFGFRLRNWCWRRISDWVFGVLWVDYVFEVLLDLLLIFGAHQFIRDRKLVTSFRVLLFFIIDKMTIALKWYVVVSFSFWWLLQGNHFFTCFWAFLHDSHLHIEGFFTDKVIIGGIY